MALPATDNFNGTTGDQLTTYSSNWTLNDGDFDIQSNAVAPDDSLGNNECGAHWNADTFDDDQYAEGTIVAINTQYIGVAVRANTGGSANYYGYYANNSESFVFKQVSGSWTQLGSTGNSFSVSNTIRLESEGTTLTPVKNGSTDTSIGAQTDSALSSGAAGLSGFFDSTGVRLDDWEGSDLGGADPLPNVSDTVTVTESVAATVSEANVSTSDTVTLSESAIANLVSSLAVSDAITANEAITRQLVSFIAANDTVAVAEAISRQLVSFITANDTITLADTPLLEMVSFIAANDGVGITEAVNVLLQVIGELTISTSEAITLADTPLLEMVSFITANDGVTITEAIARQLVSFITANDTITLADTPLLEMVSFIAANDGVSVTEAVNVLLQVIGELTISTSEAITLADTPIIENAIAPLAASEAITVNDLAQILPVLSNVVTSESVTVAEAIKQLLISFIAPNETVTVTDVNDEQIPVLFVTENEEVTVAENTTLQVLDDLSPVVSDTVTVSELVSLTVSGLFISISDAVTVSESVTVQQVVGGVFQVTVNDTVTLSEFLDVDDLGPKVITSDSIAVTDTVFIESGTPDRDIAPFETVGVTQNFFVRIPEEFIAESDLIAIVDTPTVQMADLTINISETITVTDTVLMNLLLSVVILRTTYKRMR